MSNSQANNQNQSQQKQVEYCYNSVTTVCYQLMTAQQKQPRDIKGILNKLKTEEQIVNNDQQTTQEQKRIRLKKLKRLTSLYNETMKSFSCYYNQQTRNIYHQLDKQEQTQIYKRKKATIDLINQVQSEQYQRNQAQSNPSQPNSSALKLNKLRKLYNKVDAQQQDKEDDWQKPIFIKPFFKGMLDNAFMQLNFLFIAGWIINFTLAYKDNSQCSNIPFEGIDIPNFKRWLEINAWITLACCFFFSISILFRKMKWQQKYQVDNTKLQNEKLKKSQSKQNLHFDAKETKESSITANKQTQQQQPTACSGCKKYVTRENVLSSFAFLLFLLKCAWIIFGIKLYLNNVDLAKCKSTLQNYLSIEFTIFFVLFIIVAAAFGLLITYCLRKTICRKIVKHNHFYQLSQTDPQPQLQNQIQNSRNAQNLANPQNVRNANENDNNQNNTTVLNRTSSASRGNNKTPKYSCGNLLIHANGQDLNDLMTKLMVWTLIGWVYNLFIWIKDTSTCLNQTYDHVSLTYRQWVKYDGIITLIIFGYLLAFAFYIVLTKTQIRLWSRQSTGIYRVELGLIFTHGIAVNAIIYGVLILLLLARITWIVFGVVFFFVYVDINNCNDNVSNFTMAYFTEWIFILIQGMVFIINGCRAKSILNKYYSAQKNLQNNELESGVQINIKDKHGSETQLPVSSTAIIPTPM